jgi:methyltransferase (TIGR00027 family)
MRKDTPSRTAQVVALCTLCVARESPALVPADSRDWLVRLLRANGLALLAFLTRVPIVRRAIIKRADRVVPGICLHYALRKRAIRKAVEQSKVKQLVVLAGGLDPLGILLSKYGVKVWEVDASSSVDAKRKAAKDCEVTFLSHDLLDSGLLDDLQSNGFDRDLPTAIVAEGIFMYLSPGAVEELLRTFSRTGITFVFTMMELGPSGKPGFRASPGLDQWLEKVGEPFTFGMMPGDVEGWLATLGWQQDDLQEARELRDQGQTSAEGEYVVVATT